MCLFCQIAAREIPASVVYENEQVLAFLDIKPVNPGHTLVIPKKHYANLEEIPAAELSAVMAAVKTVGALLKERLGVIGYNVIENNDPVAGQVINHLHFHIIPRQAGDGHSSWRQKDYAPGEAEKILEKLHE